MNTYKAVEICEGFRNATEEEQIEAWQFLIDEGIVWRLQGSFVRTAKQLIDAGVCTLKNFPPSMSA
jgi:hypothetical protein